MNYNIYYQSSLWLNSPPQQDNFIEGSLVSLAFARTNASL